MKICSKCGFKVLDNQKYCPRCGVHISSNSPKNTSKNIIINDEKQKTENKFELNIANNTNNSNRKKTIIVSIIITIIILIIVTITIFIKLPDQPPPVVKEKIETEVDKVNKRKTDPDAYLLPDSASDYIDKSYISQFDKDTLAFMRNEIYARHGYVFPVEPYKSYFNSKSWYSPNYSFKGDDEEINDYEYKNVRTIKLIEEAEKVEEYKREFKKACDEGRKGDAEEIRDTVKLKYDIDLTYDDVKNMSY